MFSSVLIGISNNTLEKCTHSHGEYEPTLPGKCEVKKWEKNNLY